MTNPRTPTKICDQFLIISEKQNGGFLVEAAVLFLVHLQLLPLLDRPIEHPCQVS